MSSTSDDNTLAPTASKDSESGRKKVGLRDRVNEFNWSWFTCTQSTGGVAVVLSETPHRFAGLQTIGIVMFIFNLVVFFIFFGLLVARWVMTPARIKESFIKAPTNYFFGSFWLSLATIVICAQRFGVPHCGPWLIVAIRVCFWIYAAVTLLSSIIHIVVIFKCTPIKVVEMNPAWFLLIFNTMLTGTIAGAIAQDQPPVQRLPIIVAGIGYQGLGWIVSMIFLAHFVGHQLEKGWPAPDLRPGLFMPVGSSGFTIVAIIGAARAIPANYAYFAVHPTAPEVLLIVATWMGIFMWVFTFWLFGLAFCVTVASIFVKKDGRWLFQMGFHMSWWGE